MNERINDIIARIQALQRELEAEIDQTRTTLRYHLEGRKVRFEQEILAQQRRFKERLLPYILHAHPKHLLVIPFIYPVILPFVLLDFFATLYQWVCFPIYGMPRVRRSDHFMFDRHQLAYLNLLEKLNCAYCSYANGLISYLREIVGRTEQYWCPIKHARRLLDAHPYYERFTEYGDAESYRSELPNLRRFEQ